MGHGADTGRYRRDAAVSGKSSEELNEAIAALQAEIVAAVPPWFVRFLYRASAWSVAFTPRWPIWLRAGLGTFGLLEGLVDSNLPGGQYLGLGAALVGMWLLMGALRDME